jgi:hypothetical protein
VDLAVGTGILNKDLLSPYTVICLFGHLHGWVPLAIAGAERTFSTLPGPSLVHWVRVRQVCGIGPEGLVQERVVLRVLGLSFVT